jgi:NDP-sugar pyrophosphorylase family protein
LVDQAGLAGVTAAIFAGGLGTRLRASVADRPKVLAEVSGRPFLAHLLDQLEAAGVRDAVLCTGYLGEQIEAAFGAAHGTVRLRYSRESEPLGTGGALRLAAPLFESDPVLVLNGDSYCGADLAALRARHTASGAEGTILLTHVPDAGRYGRVLLGAGGVVEAFREKSSSEPGWINAGLYLLSRRLIESIPVEGAVSLEQDILPAWVSRGLSGHPAEGRFIDIGTPESYAEAERFFAG